MKKPEQMAPAKEYIGDDEKDAEIRRLQGVIDDLHAGMQSKDAEITTLRAGSQKVYADLCVANKMLAAANNPTIGVAPPAKIEDLPTLDQLPVHPAIES